MRLYEHEAKKVFVSKGIKVPALYGVIHKPEEFGSLDVKYPVMLKSMVLVGGRGKAGGIKRAKTPKEAKAAIAELFSLTIKGYTVETVAVEAMAEEKGAC